MTDLTRYIAINRFLMTPKEMAQELNVPLCRVTRIMKENEWQALSKSDRVKDFIKKHKDLPAEDIAAKLGCSAVLILTYAKQEKIKLPTRYRMEQAATRDRQALINAKPKEMPLTEWQKKWLNGEVDSPKAPVKREKGVYTQSSSPFKLADDCRNIKTK